MVSSLGIVSEEKTTFPHSSVFNASFSSAMFIYFLYHNLIMMYLGIVFFMFLFLKLLGYCLYFS